MNDPLLKRLKKDLRSINNNFNDKVINIKYDPNINSYSINLIEFKNNIISEYRLFSSNYYDTFKTYLDGIDIFLKACYKRKISFDKENKDIIFNSSKYDIAYNINKIFKQEVFKIYSIGEFSISYIDKSIRYVCTDKKLERTLLNGIREGFLIASKYKNILKVKN